MSDCTVKRIDEMEAVYRGGLKRARAELGVEAFGMAVIDLPPEFAHYPEHDHRRDGQEEVYLALRGGGEIEVDGERHPLDAEHLVRVGPGARRKVWPGPAGVRMVVVGGIPGAAYVAPRDSELGQPDPLAAS